MPKNVSFTYIMAMWRLFLMNKSAADTIKSYGYVPFKVMKNVPHVCVVKDDETMITVESAIHKIIEISDGKGDIFGNANVIMHTKKEVRDGKPLSRAEDLDYDVISHGELTCKVNNGIVLSMLPVIVQINRSGVRLRHNEEHYEVSVSFKIKTSGALTNRQ